MQISESTSALIRATDNEQPLRLVYWSAVEVLKESERLEKEYAKLLIRLRVWHSFGSYLTRVRNHEKAKAKEIPIQVP